MGGGKPCPAFYSTEPMRTKTTQQLTVHLDDSDVRVNQVGSLLSITTTTATPCTFSSAPKAGNSCARRSTSAPCRLLIADTKNDPAAADPGDSQRSPAAVSLQTTATRWLSRKTNDPTHQDDDPPLREADPRCVHGALLRRHDRNNFPCRSR